MASRSEPSSTRATQAAGGKLEDDDPDQTPFNTYMRRSAVSPLAHPRKYIRDNTEEERKELESFLDRVVIKRARPGPTIFRCATTFFPGHLCHVTVRFLKSRDPYVFLVRAVEPSTGLRGELSVHRRLIADALNNYKQEQEDAKAAEAGEAALKERLINRSIYRDGEGRRRYVLSPGHERKLRRAALAKAHERETLKQHKLRKRRELRDRGMVDHKRTAGGTIATSMMSGDVSSRASDVWGDHPMSYDDDEDTAAGAGGGDDGDGSTTLFDDDDRDYVGAPGLRHSKAATWHLRPSPAKHISTPGFGDEFVDEDAARRWELAHRPVEVFRDAGFETPRDRNRDLVYERPDSEYPIVPKTLVNEDIRLFLQEFVLCNVVEGPLDGWTGKRKKSLELTISSDAFAGQYVFGGNVAPLSRRSTGCLTHNPLTDGQQCPCPFCSEMHEALKKKPTPMPTPRPPSPPPPPPPKLPELSRTVRSWYVPEQPVRPWNRWREEVRERQRGKDPATLRRFTKPLLPLPEAPSRYVEHESLVYDWLSQHENRQYLRRLLDVGAVEWVRLRSPADVLAQAPT